MRRIIGSVHAGLASYNMYLCSILQSLMLSSERPTEYQEDDVFVTECRYNEADKETKKMKGLKVGLLAWEETKVVYITVPSPYTCIYPPPPPPPPSISIPLPLC